MLCLDPNDFHHPEEFFIEIFVIQFAEHGLDFLVYAREMLGVPAFLFLVGRSTRRFINRSSEPIY